ncbi:MAG: energy transducer TonB [Pyrinomonadaceae bacterium]|nr:energy transducer TonB [Pyrinomonadaceae bacterium]MCX7640430.1 energy transducer TonB [Pyrinomonadaceae bacterium]
MMLRVLAVFLLLFSTSFSQLMSSAEAETIRKAKAYFASGNCSAASEELGKMKRESSDEVIKSAADSMLAECYVIQSDYKGLQKLLEESFQTAKTQNNLQNYIMVSAQVIKNIKSKIERYKILGVSFNDTSLPKEVTKDIEKMREVLEKVIQQSSSLQDTSLLALIEESCATRSSLAKDEYDSNYWKELAEDIKDELRNGRKTIAVVEEEEEINTDKAVGPTLQNRLLNAFQSTTKEETIKVGSLVEYAIKKVSPVYPAVAKQLKISGLVRVEVIVDESGKVTTIKSVSGHPILQTAAVEAIKKWEFKPFTKEGRHVRAEGFVILNFVDE